jgi:DNA-binding MarR family transcriptional regulator
MTHIRLATDDAPPPAGAGTLGALAAMLVQISAQLDGASDELQRIASESSRANDVQIAGAPASMEIDVRRARALRSLRKKLLGEDYFSGSSWEILLHLFETHLRQLRESMGNVSLGTEIPLTTVLRWTERLEGAGLILVRDDPFDARRRYVELTPHAANLMTKYFLGATTHLIAA